MLVITLFYLLTFGSIHGEPIRNKCIQVGSDVSTLFSLASNYNFKYRKLFLKCFKNTDCCSNHCLYIGRAASGICSSDKIVAPLTDEKKYCIDSEHVVGKKSIN